MNAKPLEHLWPLAIVMMICSGMAPASAADPVYHWRILAGVHTIAIVPPQFLLPPSPPAKVPRKTAHHGKPPAVTEEQKQAVFGELAARLWRELPPAVAQYGRFRVASAADVQHALAALKLQPAAFLVLPPGRKKGWPAANLADLQKLAAALHVDAVVVCAMRPPQSVGEHIDITRQSWDPDPFDIGLLRVPLHVVSPRAHAMMITRAGDLAWEDEMSQDHPRTDPRTLATLQVDWDEATNELAQDLSDSINRLPPLTHAGTQQHRARKGAE